MKGCLSPSVCSIASRLAALSSGVAAGFSGAPAYEPDSAKVPIVPIISLKAHVALPAHEPAKCFLQRYHDHGKKAIIVSQSYSTDVALFSKRSPNATSPHLQANVFR
ncbi:unnamed protein product, partial [Laminaria digitata]